MELMVFSVRDAKAGIFNLPFMKHTKAEAEREFTRLARDKSTTVNMFPEDFDLYYLGVFDDKPGLIKPLDTPQHLMKAIEIREQ